VVRTERIGPVTVLTIDRPERRNAIDGPTADELEHAFTRFAGDESARVLVVTGAGEEAFCAGADLFALETLRDRMDAPAGPLGFTRRLSPKPTIAAVSGWCVAGGLELALWCDVRIASPTATFGCTERRFGVPLVDGGTQRLPRIVGAGRALELVLTGRLVGAEEARAIGLVNEVVGHGRHLERALTMAEGIADFPQETLLSDRRALLEGLGVPLADGLELERRLGREQLHSALRGAERFRRGEGRGASGTGA